MFELTGEQVGVKPPDSDLLLDKILLAEWTEESFAFDLSLLLHHT